MHLVVAGVETLVVVVVVVSTLLSLVARLLGAAVVVTLVAGRRLRTLFSRRDRVLIDEKWLRGVH